MTPAARGVARAALGLLGITAAGTLGYVWVEDLRPFDALYMTVITVATVGYGEVQPLSPSGRLFTIALIVCAGGTGAYLLARIAQLLVETSLSELLGRRAMERRVADLRDHVIVCGYGRLGRVVVEELARNRVPYVVIESDPAREPELARGGAPYLIASAAQDDALQRAGIARARAIVVGTGSDSDNVFITLSARELNPRVRIHARGESDAALRRLELAGAHQVVSAYQMGGARLASAILRPAVVDFLEISHARSGEEVDLEEVRIGDGCALCGETVRELERRAPRLRIVALKRGDARIELVPGEAERIGPGDLLVVIGDRASLGAFAELAARA